MKKNKLIIKKKNYTFDKKFLYNKTQEKKIINFFNNNGFCVIKDIIPKKEILTVRNEIKNAQKEINKNIENIKNN